MSIILVACIGLFYGADVGYGSHVVEVRCKRIGIIGGGASGLAGAFALTQSSSVDFDVSLFESEDVFGGAARSVTDPVTGIVVDHAFHAFSEYHNFEALLDELGVEKSLTASGGTITLQSAMNTSGSTNETLLTFPSGLVSRSMVEDKGIRDQQASFASESGRLKTILQRVAETWSVEELMTVTLGTLLDKHAFDGAFRKVYLTTCLKVYVASAVALFEMPVGLIHYLERLFGLCISQGRVSYHSVTKGAGEYVKMLLDKLETSVKLRPQSPIKWIRRGPGQQLTLGVRDKDTGEVVGQHFDQVVFAVSKEVALSILNDVDSDAIQQHHDLYESVLGAADSETPSRYESWTTIIHNDSANVEQRLAATRDAAGCYNAENYNFNAFENISQKDSEFDESRLESVLLPALLNATTSCVRNFTGIYLNGFAKESLPLPDPSTQLERLEWRHLSHDVSAFRASRALHTIQGLGRMWFAGGDVVTLNLHEPAVASGLVVAHALGSPYPFEQFSLARQSFLRFRAWMLFGTSPVVPLSAPTFADRNRCTRCRLGGYTQCTSLKKETNLQLQTLSLNVPNALGWQVTVVNVNWRLW